MKFLHSYVPFLIALVAGVIVYDQATPWIYGLLLIACAAFLLIDRKWCLLGLGMILVFQTGIFLRQYRENEFLNVEKNVQPYLKQRVVIEGVVATHPVPSFSQYSYVIETTQIDVNGKIHPEKYRIQINSKSYQSPEKGDVVRLTTKLYIPSTFQNFQKVKHVHAYGTVFGDYNWTLISAANLTSTKIRNKIFKSARQYLSPMSYGYFRAMVFGDQAFLDQATMARLKETGLLHLFVISGFHISFVWLIGFSLFRLSLSGLGFFHRRKEFFLWIECGSILTVLVFLQWINPPVSTVRAVGTMALFFLLRLIRRNQNALWNLGVVFMFVIAYNPLLLFDISTQLTFASVAGIFSVSLLVNKKIEFHEMKWISRYLLKASLASLGAGLFTFPILYFQFGTFYPISFLYNLIVVPTIGSLVSCLSVASLIWPLIPFEPLHQIAFGLLDFLFKIIERVLFFKPEFEWSSVWSYDVMGVSGLYWVLGAGVAGMAFIITRRFSKESPS